jgi:uncharacterized repeat protein (TIGR01451 family)
MKKPLRALFTALLFLSLFGLASCNRNWGDDCFSPCEVRCPPKCDPCPPCPPKCDPCLPPRCAQPCSAPCAQPCGPMASCGSQGSFGPVECSSEPNPYYPCDPSFFPCGNGKCGGSYEPAFPVETCYGRLKTYTTCDDCVVDLCQIAPEFATVGSAYPVEIVITARKECADVVINQTLPCDSEFIKSEPPAAPDHNGQLHWSFPHLKQGESQRVVVWIKPTREGCCLAAATVCACPQLCAYTQCGQPVICIRKCGPECACLYCPIRYTIQVTNSGSAPAYDVVVQDNVPDGLTHASGYNCLNYQLGTLCPGDCRTIDVDFCASKPGLVCNTAAVSYCGGPKCVSEACTMIVQPCVEVTKTGPDWAYICKPVDYTITVTNPGDLVLRNVVIEDISPGGTTVVAAPGAEVCCNKAVWTLCELCPGETRTFCITVRSQVAGCLTNTVSVTTQSDCGPCSVCAEAITCWKGIAATHMCMVDTCDPICIGDTTVYRICVTNRGSADDSNVQLVINFTNQLQPQCVNGPTRGMISGNTVTFEPLERLSPKQSVEYCITVRGVAPGDARAEAILTSDMLGAPVESVEATHVY